MADRWIVTSFNFAEHSTQDAAETEADRLRAKLPGTKFRVIRVKTTLKRSNAEAVIKELQTALAGMLAVHNLSKAVRSLAFERAEVVLKATDYFERPPRCPDDRTPASTPAVSPETNPNPAHVQHLKTNGG